MLVHCNSYAEARGVLSCTGWTTCGKTDTWEILRKVETRECEPTPLIAYIEKQGPGCWTCAVFEANELEV